MAVDSAHAVGSFFTQLLQAKRDGALPADGLAAVFEAGALHVLSLKQAHRELCEASEALREATSEAKTQLDQSSLQLQNLLYEQQHYEKEIAGCRAFQSAYPDSQLELVPEAEFRAQWAGARKPAGDAELGDDPHAVMLARLSHELTSREETVKQADAIKAKRDVLAADVAQKRSRLSALEAEVAKLRAAAQVVQQQFKIAPAAGLGEAGRLAAMLPLPLYMLWTQLSVARAALPVGGRVEVGLEVANAGDAAAVEGLKAMHSSASAPNVAPALPAAAPTGALHEEFPLSVALTLRTPGAAAPALSVAFRYLPALGLVTAAGARPEQDAVLAGLFPGDDGGALPGPVPGSAGEAAGGGGEVDVRQLQGRPYRWAQHAAGIDILPPLPPAMYVAAAAGGGEQAGSLAEAAAAVQQYAADRRAAAVLSKLVEAVQQGGKK